MTSALAREKAAQVWCTEKNSHKILDPDLDEAFAEILDYVWNQAWLGNATTGELLQEVQARLETDGRLDYRTVDNP